jgi:deoxyribonuclease-4
VGPRLKICIDLCHLYVDQYDLATSAGRNDFSSAVKDLGIDSIAAIHVSDSFERHGGTRDEHAE